MKAPADFLKALSKNKAAKAAWDKSPPSHQKEHIEAILGAKKEETRARRIEKSIAMLAAADASGGKGTRLSKPSEKPLAKKIGLKAGHTLVAINVPGDYAALLGDLPEGAKLGTKDGDVVHVFAKDPKELAKYFPKAQKALGERGQLWISYVKGSDALNRDKGWDAVKKAGFEGVSLVAVDATWSALKFRRA